MKVSVPIHGGKDGEGIDGVLDGHALDFPSLMWDMVYLKQKHIEQPTPNQSHEHH